MIYFTTLIFILLLSHIARAVPACGDDAPPKDLYDPMYDDVLPLFYKVTWDKKYDNKHGKTKTLTCSHYLQKYPEFDNIPNFPSIGGGFSVESRIGGCQQCWQLRYRNHSIFFAAIDHVETGFVVSHEAFVALNGGEGTVLYAKGEDASLQRCHFPPRPPRTI